MLKRARLILVGLAILISAGPTWGWGRTGHRLINELALEALRTDATTGRPGAATAYRLLDGQRFLFVAEAGLPDIAVQSDPAQSADHFLDLEDFGGLDFIRALRPTRPADAPDDLGRLPWAVGACARELRTAVRHGRTAAALRAAIWLAHLAADAHTPLHTTRDFDGRSIEAKGVHARWEWRLAEAMAGLDSIAVSPPRDLFATAAPVAAAALESGAVQATAGAIEASFQLVDGLLADDERARASAGWANGAPQEWDATAPGVAAYLRDMERLQGDVVRERLTAAVRLVADLIAAAAAGQRATPRIRLDELRLEKRAVDSTPDELRVSLSLLRLSISRSVAPYQIEVRDAARPADKPWFSVPVNPSRECGGETTMIVAVPRTLCEGVAMMELRLVPGDAITPEDNRVYLRRRAAGLASEWK